MNGHSIEVNGDDSMVNGGNGKVNGESIETNGDSSDVNGESSEVNGGTGGEVAEHQEQNGTAEDGETIVGLYKVCLQSLQLAYLLACGLLYCHLS